MVDCPGNSAIDPLFSLISAVSSQEQHHDCWQLSPSPVPDPGAALRLPLVRVHQGRGRVDLRGQGGSRQEGIYELREILNFDNKVSYKFSAVKGAQGLKDYLEEENFIEDSGSSDEGYRFSLQGQHCKFPPLLFDSFGSPILPADNINNTDMEVSLKKGEVVTIYCPGKKVQCFTGDSVNAVCDH